MVVSHLNPRRALIYIFTELHKIPFETARAIVRSMRHREIMARLRAYPEVQLHALHFPQCPICLHTVPYRVIDHDHGTGLCRALICEQCNGKLGALENDPGRYLRQRRRPDPWRQWVTENAERIYEHLHRQCDIPYRGERQRFLKAEKEKVSGSIFREAAGAIGNLTINGMESRAGKQKMPMPVVESFPGSGAEPQMLKSQPSSKAGARFLRRLQLSGSV